MINYLYTYFTFRFHLVDGGFRANMNAKTSGQRPGDVDCCILGWMIYETFSGAGNWKARWKKRLPFRWLVNFGGGRRNRG